MDGRPAAGLRLLVVGASSGSADRDLLSLLFRSWVEHGQLPAQMSALNDVANTLVSLVITAHANPSVVPEIVQLSPRIRPNEPLRGVCDRRLILPA